MELQRRQHRGSVQRQQIILLDTCQEQEPEEVITMPKRKIETQLIVEAENVPAKSMTNFEGLYGNVKLLEEGFVQYQDSHGMTFGEAFDPKKITKSFPWGISLGGLTKSIWFKDGAKRDDCFVAMSKTANMKFVEPAKTNFAGERDNANYEVFKGLGENEVVLYPVNRVEYTDLQGQRHSVSYKRAWIKKCFPSGICFGGLPKTLWLIDERQRDKCFNCMKKQEQDDEDLNEREEEKKLFTGLYGDVFLKEDYKVEFTSLVGDQVTSSYDPRKIRKVFPMGITSLALPSTIWFSEMKDCESCYQEMKKTY